MSGEFQRKNQFGKDFAEDGRKGPYEAIGFPNLMHSSFLDHYINSDLDPVFQKQVLDLFKKESFDASQRGYNLDFWFIRDVMGFFEDKKRLVFAGGNAAYSVLSYVLGLTDNIDFRRGYRPEMLYGIKKDRRPYIPLIVPWDFEEDLLVKYLKTTYGEKNVEYDGCAYTISLHIEEKRYPFSLSLIKDCTLYFAERLLKKECDEKTISNSCRDIICRETEMDYTMTNTVQSSLNSVDLKEVISDFVMLFHNVDECIINNFNGFLTSTLDGTTEGLMHAVAVIKGTNIWDGTDESAASNGIYTRDDVYDYCLKFLDDKEKAFSIMEKVRKGRKLNEKELIILTKAGASDAFIKACNKLRYIVSEGSIMPYVQILLYLTDFRIRKEKLYKTVLQEVVEQTQQLL